MKKYYILVIILTFSLGIIILLNYYSIPKNNNNKNEYNNTHIQNINISKMMLIKNPYSDTYIKYSKQNKNNKKNKFYISTFSQKNRYKIVITFKPSSQKYNPFPQKILTGTINNQRFTIKIPFNLVNNALEFQITDMKTNKKQVLSANFLKKILELPENENLQIFINLDNISHFTLSSTETLSILPGPK